jgi:hypothetical protein
MADLRELLARADAEIMLADMDVLRTALRLAEYVLANEHSTDEHDEALRCVREALLLAALAQQKQGERK